MEYDQFVRGCHIGVFPSYYEPWGYTPLECVVSGIPAITSDLSGFGDFVSHHFPDHNADGMFVARRRGVSFEATVAQVVDWLYALTRMSRRERISLRNKVEAHAEYFDWSHLSQHYVTAHRLALARRFPGVRAAPVARELEPDEPVAAETLAGGPPRRRARKTRRRKEPGG
jgi:glycogen(starch) synthase